MLTRDDFLWSEDFSHFVLNGFHFVEVQNPPAHSHYVPGENCFLFHKMKGLVDQYVDYFAAHPMAIRNMVELGLYQGGSIPFWFELLSPRKYVGVDIRDPIESKYHKDYIDRRGLEGRIELAWRTNQTHAELVTSICRTAFGGEPLDLVVDDASHFYEETKTSFEILFALLRPGGLYIIEDWAWWHWRGFENEFQDKVPLTYLLFDMVEVLGSTGQDVISAAHIQSGFAVIQRGVSPAPEHGHLNLDDLIYHHSGRTVHR